MIKNVASIMTELKSMSLKLELLRTNSYEGEVKFEKDLSIMEKVVRI
ncbi:hypothetical protein [Clostridium intestinale]|nr:hypothetical protein [Clostridium intestinale]